jgi:trans-aconitate methyltransferase
VPWRETFVTFSTEFYNEGWHRWDDMKVFGPSARHTRRFIFSLMDGLSFQTVLDAGCGTGVLLRHISEAYPHVRLSGTEYAAEGLGFARQRLPRAEFHELDLSRETLPGKFDLVVCIDVLEHIPDDRAALKNLRAMTAGHMILSVPLGKLFQAEVERMGHVHGYTRTELESTLRETGFGIVRAIQWGFPFYNIHRRMANLMPAGTSTGSFSRRKKLISNLLYLLFFLNVSYRGERYYVLCRPFE